VVRVTAVSAPASSANLGPGFDVLGLALDRRTTVGSGEPPEGAQRLDGHHPAVVAHRRAGGAGDLWGIGGIPMGRGLGFSGAVRVAGAMLAHVERDGADAASDDSTRASVLELTAELEGHPDNVAASVYGGLVIADNDLVVPIAVDPTLAIVAWVPSVDSTSTDRSRATLAPSVTRSDAVYNMARVAALVAAVSAGDVDLLARCVGDRLHQAARFAEAPGSAAAAAAMAEVAELHGVWLSGSGPTVAAWSLASDLDRAVQRVRSVTGAQDDQVLGLAVDRVGVRVEGDR